MDYIAVHIRISPFSEEAAEIIEAGIDDLGFESYTVEEPFLNAFIPREKFSARHLAIVLDGFDLEGVSLEHTEEFIAEQNWNAAWESDFQPVVVDGLITVRATYHKELPRTKYNIVIDPQMSFGSGHHQTTCMMLKGLLNESRGLSGDGASVPGEGPGLSGDRAGASGVGRGLRGRRVLDMGCGTGILSIAAAKLGAEVPVHAVDIDPVCVRSANANAKRNRVAHKIINRLGDASLLQKGQYDIVLANINRNILLSDMSTYVRSLKPEGGCLLLSGFFTADIPILLEKAASLGLSLEYQLEEEGWAMLKLQKHVSPE